MTTYLVGFSGSASTGQVKASSFAAVPWTSLVPGDTVLIYPGIYSGISSITGAVGTANNPIRITTGVDGSWPVFTDSIDIQASSYLDISGLIVQAPTYAGFILENASHHVVIHNNVVFGGTSGASVSTNAGLGNQIVMNVFAYTATFGVGVDGHLGNSSDLTVIQSNTVVGCAQHGMEIRGSNCLIEHNNVSYCGKSIGGTSGIHLYAVAANDGTGQNNIVRYNNCWAQWDLLASDGNGIQVDHYCNGNLVAYNVCWSCDGAGVIVYDSANNRVHNNTLYGNGLDRGTTHGALGQLIVNGTLSAYVTNNLVYNNIAASTLTNVPGMYVDPRAVAAANTIGPNLFHIPNGGTALQWTDHLSYTAASALSSATGTVGDLVEVASFADTTQLLSNGLRLTAAPSALGTFPTGEVDILNQLARVGQSSFGAYFF